MKYSAALSTQVHLAAIKHLVREDGQEDLCFALWNPSSGAGRETACLEQLVLPKSSERLVHGNVSFLPSYLERVIALARKGKHGIALLHSHLGPGWQGMSGDDIRAEQGNAAAVFAATDLPLVGLTAGTDGAWSARFWLRIGPRKYKRHWCESVRVVGDGLLATYCDDLIPPPQPREELVRTVSAWGEKAQADLARLRVGIVGTGSVGAIVAETLARMGISRLRLIDFDVVERINLDRLLHATANDAKTGRLKVEMLAEHLKLSATANPFEIDALDFSVVEEAGYRAALDCDVLFSCVDRPWPRFLLNFIAYAHLIPVIDGGILITPMKNGTGLKRATWRAHVAAPTRRCLECLGQYDPANVSLERSGLLDAPTYIEGLPKDHELRSNENVFGFSLSVASMEIEQFLRMTIPHPGHANIGAQTTHFVRGQTDTDTSSCNPNCPFCSLVAKGDRSGITDITGYHHAAEKARVARKQKPRKASILRTVFTKFRFTK